MNKLIDFSHFNQGSQRAMNQHKLYTCSYIIFFALVLFTNPLVAWTQEETSAAQDARYDTGKKIFKRYCVKCHGKKADGEGRMTKKLYRKKRTQLPANFNLGIFIDRPEAYLRKVITDGGEKNDLSHYMPPYKGEISAQGIEDLIHFIKKTAQIANVKNHKN